MPDGEMIFVITGDISTFDKKVDEAEAKRKAYSKRAIDTYETILQQDNILGKQVDRTTQLSTQKIQETQEHASKVGGEVSDFMKGVNEDIEKITALLDAYRQEQKSTVDRAEERLRQFDLRAKLTITNTLFVLRSFTDSLALLAAVTGEQINTSYLSLISMGLSSAMQVQMQAAIYATTPGGQPLALMMLAMLPMITGTINFFKAEQARVQQAAMKQNNDQLDSYLDGIAY